MTCSIMFIKPKTQHNNNEHIGWVPFILSVINAKCHKQAVYAECRYAECYKKPFMLNDIMLSVIMLSAKVPFILISPSLYF